MKCDPIFEAVEAILGKEFVEAKLASAMGGAWRDFWVVLTKRVPQRTRSAQWAVAPSEDCLSD